MGVSRVSGLRYVNQGLDAKYTYLLNRVSIPCGMALSSPKPSVPPRHNYTKPIPDHEIERHLRGAIYDPLIRKIVIDGIGGRWQDEVNSWLECPGQQDPEPLSLWQQTKQLVHWEGLEASDTDDEAVCPYHWATPIHQMNCEWIWPKEMDEPPMVVRRRPSLACLADHHRTLTWSWIHPSTEGRSRASGSWRNCSQWPGFAWLLFSTTFSPSRSTSCMLERLSPKAL
jgi:hypothetical protein